MERWEGSLDSVSPPFHHCYRHALLFPMEDEGMDGVLGAVQKIGFAEVDGSEHCTTRERRLRRPERNLKQPFLSYTEPLFDSSCFAVSERMTQTCHGENVLE